MSKPTGTLSRSGTVETTTTTTTIAMSATHRWKTEPAGAPDSPAASSSSAGNSSAKTNPDAPSSIRNEASEQPAPSAHGKRVLIVEDDCMNARALRSIFTRKGCDVATVNTLKDAIPMLDARRDYIVLDLMLPDGDGLEVLKHVARGRSGMPPQRRASSSPPPSATRSAFAKSSSCNRIDCSRSRSISLICSTRSG